MDKFEAWRKWWMETHGKNMPMGGYHPREGFIYDAFTAGWEARTKYDAFRAGWEAHVELPTVQSKTSDAQSTNGEG